MTELDEINIRHIKLTDATEIITMVIDAQGDVLNIEKPLLLNFMYEEDDTISYYFTKFCPFSRDGKIKLNARNVIAYSDVGSEMKARYVKSAVKLNAKSMDDVLAAATDDDNTEDVAVSSTIVTDEIVH